MTDGITPPTTNGRWSLSARCMAALVPLDEGHPTTRETHQGLPQHDATLRPPTLKSARGNGRLQRDNARRRAGEPAREKDREVNRILFMESQVMFAIESTPGQGTRMRAAIPGEDPKSRS